MQTPPMPALVLASTSPYRKELLERLRIPFQCASPDCDEAPLANEAPPDTARRLAAAKALAVAHQFPDALIIGSDQVAHCDGHLFGKPHTVERAIAQLHALSGKTIHFDTALALLDRRVPDTPVVRVVSVEVGFRHLAEEEIARYVTLEMPLNCAGSAKSEGLGISLMRYMRGDDPTALVGLPLIALCEMLREKHVTIP